MIKIPSRLWELEKDLLLVKAVNSSIGRIA